MNSSMTSVQIRERLVDALKLDLVGPGVQLGDAAEVLPQSPSRWYLTGFLAPLDAKPEQRSEADADDDLDAAGETGLDDDVAPEPAAAAKQRYLPSSIGLSILLPSEASELSVEVRWGDYRREGDTWRREPRQEAVRLPLTRILNAPVEYKVPASDGLRVALMVQPVGSFAAQSGLPDGARTVSVFLVNRRTPKELSEIKDEAFAFQTALTIHADQPFLARPDTRGLLSDDWDENVADLQYRDVGEYAVGHNVAAAGDSHCVYTCWIPEAQVERVAPASIPGIVLEMDQLAALTDAADAEAKLLPLVQRYREWIERQRANVPANPPKRAQTGQSLLNNARVAADRMERGIRLLARPECLRAFRWANQTMAEAARRRANGFAWSKPGGSISGGKPPAWRPFQLAFVLMNLPGVAEPEGDDRKVVDLLFFPTGGGKTEAYLGLAAFTLLLRRLQNPGVNGAGVSVLMRYTLRLLTLDQLSRAATLICALELLREQETSLGDWPFEIGLWVGRAATPNEMGSKDRDHPDTARRRTISFWNDDRKPSPIPLEECPWCGQKFQRESFRLTANGRSDRDYPTDLQIGCMNRACDFNRGRMLPVVAVDEPIYRRLPCFLIATVDKFAGMPWTGAIAGFFGRVQRYDRYGFYGPTDPDRGSFLSAGELPPPDLIIQDELHLISGPLGTMVGLYETALEELSVRDLPSGSRIRPKIVASTATVRRADSQIQALFNREQVDIFPPPGPNRRDSFFACTLTPEDGKQDTNARLYVGVAAQGRSPKVAMLRVYLALLGAGQKFYNQYRQAADPYMTLVGYFNALRELGGARRLIEDEVRNRLAGYGSRRRVGETEGLFANREIDYEPVELTSRIDTSSVSEAKRRLGLLFSDKNSADVAIATNMISVGLDIVRLGLMVVFGQPKTSAEYIQASSRVGRDPERPGLVVTILNVHKPRDRSHYERFAAYHESFYRSVEATSVTPFSPRALDKGLAASLVALARLGIDVMTPPRGAVQIATQRNALSSVAERFAERAFNHNKQLPITERDRLRVRVRQRGEDLLDDWAGVVEQQRQVGAGLQYNPHERGSGPPLLQDFLDPALKTLPPGHWKNKFRANRSMRDVEASVNVWVRSLENFELDDDQ